MNKRSYAQFCGLAKALDVVGERWTLLIVRNLILGPLRYSDLLRGLPGITTNLLAKRLKEMNAHGLIEKTRLSPSDSSAAYRLTQFGRELEPVIHALGYWGRKWMKEPVEGDERRFEWFLVSLQRRYKGGVTLSAEVMADDVPYQFTLANETLEIQRGSALAPALRLRAAPLKLIALFISGLAGIEGEIQLEGSKEDLASLVSAFKD